MKKIGLIIPVYNGGDYWKECWSKVEENIEFFQTVLISFNNGELQQDDINVLGAKKYDNVITIVQKQRLTALEHFKRIAEKISTLTCEYIMFLAHDDLLNREGLEELSKLEIGCDDAIFGSHAYFGDRNGFFTCRECCIPSNGLSSKQFVLNDIDRNYKFNVTGIIIPKKIITEVLKLSNIFLYGYRFDNVIVSNPFVDKIHQIYKPIVNIREHHNSEGAQNYVATRVKENVSYYYLNIALRESDIEFLKKCTVEMFQWITLSKKDFLSSLWHLIKIQLWLKKTYKTHIIIDLLVYFYGFLWLSRKIAGRIKNKIILKFKSVSQNNKNVQCIIKREKENRVIVFKCFYEQLEIDFGKYDGGTKYGHGLLVPICKTVEMLRKRGFEVYSSLEYPIELADIVVCIDLSKEMLKKMSELPIYCKKILICSESPIYAPESHNASILNNNIWAAVLTWNKSYEAKHIHLFDHPYIGKSYLKDVPSFRNRINKVVVVSSFKNDPRGNTHVRDKLYEELAKNGHLDIYGHGWSLKKLGVKGTTGNKIETISKYKYCLVIENSLWTGYVTEKLPDSILAGTPVIYWGDIESAEKRFHGAFVPLEKLTVDAFLTAKHHMEKKYETMVETVYKIRENSDMWSDSFIECCREVIEKI